MANYKDKYENVLKQLQEKNKELQEKNKELDEARKTIQDLECSNATALGPKFKVRLYCLLAQYVSVNSVQNTWRMGWASSCWYPTYQRERGVSHPAAAANHLSE